MSEAVVKHLKEILLVWIRMMKGRKSFDRLIIRQNSLPGAEEEFRRKLIDLYRPKG
jgi:hypothetical protein